MIYKKLSYLRIVCMVMAVILLIGCADKTRQTPKPDTGQQDQEEEEKPAPGKASPQESAQKPDLPEALDGVEGQEPSLQVFIQEENTTQEMKLEDYIKNVVAGEIKNDWPDEAIKAQAIIARTFVLNFIDEKGHSKHGKAHISTDIEEAQAWNPQDVNQKIEKAVEDTRGQVMVYDGKYAQGWFHSNAAGMTATAKEGLNYKKDNPPYIKVVESPDDSPEIPDDEKDWEYWVSKDKVIEALNSMGKEIKDFGSVTIGEKGESGRAITLSFEDTKVSAPDFRIAIGSTEMKSTLLDLAELQGDQVIFKGRGYGHGVGMSQWGAYTMAMDGKKAEDIISHYFSGVSIVKVWE